MKTMGALIDTAQLKELGPNVRHERRPQASEWLEDVRSMEGLGVIDRR
jgi:hypothetical protein